MRDPDRIAPILEEVMAFWDSHPDWRLGQIIVNCARASGYPSDDVFYLEDEQFLIGLRKMTDSP